MTSPYQSFRGSELLARDLLALDRTVMANERTLLAYLRTALVLGFGGVSLPELFPDLPAHGALGAVSLVGGAILLVVGVWRFAAMQRRYGALVMQIHAGEASPPRGPGAP